MLETERLTLRAWTETDAESLYAYAKDPDIGPIAGWPAHRSKEESLNTIRHVLNGKECYAICERGSNSSIGSIELKLNGHTDMTDRDDERKAWSVPWKSPTIRTTTLTPSPPITYSQQARDQCTNANLLTIPAADHGFIKSDFTTACNSAVTFIRNTMVLSWNALEGSWWASNGCWSRPFRAS